MPETPHICAIDAHAVRLPFVAAFAHSNAVRAETASVVVQVRLSSGATGLGEGCPRPYVTGEDLPDCLAAVQARAALLLDQPVDGLAALPLLLEGLAPAARCALELALLDALARDRGTSVAALLGPAPHAQVRYSMVFTSGRLSTVEALARRAAALGFTEAKLKVGPDAAHDAACVRLVREVMGPEVALRADANGAWTPEEAVDRCVELDRLGVHIVEDPLPASQRAQLPALRRALPAGISLLIDEAVVSAEDARALVATGGADRLLLKVSKHGGLLPTLAIAREAAQRGVPVHLGAHVGETSVLSAAGRAVAGQIALATAEGSWGPLLLARDLTTPAITFGVGGQAPTALPGPGWGLSLASPLED